LSDFTVSLLKATLSLSVARLDLPPELTESPLLR
jgi:hypothetical protein